MILKVSMSLALLMLISVICLGWYKNLTGESYPEIPDIMDLHTEQIQSLIDELEDVKFRVRVLEKENL